MFGMCADAMRVRRVTGRPAKSSSQRGCRAYPFSVVLWFSQATLNVPTPGAKRSQQFVGCWSEGSERELS